MITVADLLSRNAPAPFREADPDIEPDTEGISVGALLRREGRAPRAADRPLQPRPRQQAARDDEGGSDRSVLVRRGAIAAGTLLAAGSVLGAALLTDVTPTANQTPAPGGAEDDAPYPGQGLLDPEGPVAAPPDSVMIDQAAARDPLDPGTPAPSDWVPVAFPGALAGGGTGTEDTGGTDGGGTDGGGSSGSSGDDGKSGSLASSDDDDKTARSSSSSDSSSSGSSAGGSSRDSDARHDSGSSNDDDSDDDGDHGLVGGLVDTVGGVLGLGDDDDESDSKKSNSKNDGDEDDDKDSRSMRLLSADEGEEDSSAPQDEDDSESGSDAKSGDSDDSEGSDSDDGGDDDGDGGLVDTVSDTVGGLLG
ncbi:hypothetical protein [Pseudonocardia adelaidensis]|uniref:hypothetical protein n=1 Tax=Pseudonocardia adelaidensis TaxID=648754 RepID=UPI0031EA61A4